MECHDFESSSQYLLYLSQKSRQQRKPLNASIEVTNHCNLKCKHCYIRPRHGEKQSGSDLSLTEWKSILDEIAKQGVLYLLITGGEPLLRRDIDEIYKHAKSLGFIVTFFTNGTLLDEEKIEMFREYQPFVVELTMYGFTKETYESVTGVAGSYDQFMNGVESLVKANIRFGLKTVLMTLNEHELDDMKEYADSLGVKFRYDPAIFSTYNHNNGPLKFRVDPQFTVTNDFKDSSIKNAWLEYYHSKQQVRPELLFTCAAGRSTFHVTHDGQLQACMMLRKPSYDIIQVDLQNTWNNGFEQLLKLKIDKNSRCSECEAIHLCNFCPGFFEFETGDLTKCSTYTCELGRIRLDNLKDLVKADG